VVVEEQPPPFRVSDCGFPLNIFKVMAKRQSPFQLFLCDSLNPLNLMRLCRAVNDPTRARGTFFFVFRPACAEEEHTLVVALPSKGGAPSPVYRHRPARR